MEDPALPREKALHWDGPRQRQLTAMGRAGEEVQGVPLS